MFNQTLISGKINLDYDKNKFINNLKNYYIKNKKTIPIIVLESFNSTSNYDNFRKKLKKKDYDKEIYEALNDILNDTKYPLFVSSLLQRSGKQLDMRKKLTMFPSERISLFEFDKKQEKFESIDKKQLKFNDKYYQGKRTNYGLNSRNIKLLKEQLETIDNTNPCLEGIKVIENAIQRNKIKEEIYNQKYAIYLSELSKYNKNHNNAELECSMFANRRCWTDWTNLQVSDNTIAKLCNEKCLNTYSGSYEKTGIKESKNLGLSWRYECKFNNPKTVNSICMSRFEASNPKPIAPKRPDYEIIPEFTCQYCPNIVSTSDTTSLVDSLIKQVNNCVIEKNLEFNTIDKSEIEQPAIEETSSSEKNIVKDDSKLEYLYFIILIIIIVAIIFYLNNHTNLQQIEKFQKKNY